MSLELLKEELDQMMKDMLVGTPPEKLAGQGIGMVALDVPKGVTNTWGHNIENGHITIAYFPEVNDFITSRVARLIQKELLHCKPVIIETEGQDWFSPQKNIRVALVKKTPEIMQLKERIWKVLDEVFPGLVDKKYKEYKPHITIGKMGEVPTNLMSDCTMSLNRVLVTMKDREKYCIDLYNHK